MREKPSRTLQSHWNGTRDKCEETEDHRNNTTWFTILMIWQAYFWPQSVTMVFSVGKSICVIIWMSTKRNFLSYLSCTVYVKFNFIEHPGNTEEEIYIDSIYNELSSHPNNGSHHHVAVKSCCSRILTSLGVSNLQKQWRYSRKLILATWGLILSCCIFLCMEDLNLSKAI